MSTTTTAPAPQPAAASRPARVGPAPHLTFGRVLRSESIKTWSLRSTWWTLALTVVAFVGLVAAMSALVLSLSGNADVPPDETLSALMVYAIAVQPASLAAVTLGVLSITGEYGTGMIRSTFAAVPTRLPALWAKAVVVFGVMLGAALVAVALAVGISWLILRGDGLQVDLDAAETWRVLGGSALYLATLAVFAFAIAAIIRHSAGALATVFGLLLVVENVVAGVPWEPLKYVRPWLPAGSGSMVTMPDAMVAATSGGPNYAIHWTAWEGYAVLGGWTVLLLAVAAVLMRSRDA